MAKRGPKGRPVVWIVSENIEFYYNSIREAAKQLKQVKPEIKSSEETTSSMISLSCELPGRKVAGQKFRWATEEEIQQHRNKDGE